MPGRLEQGGHGQRDPAVPESLEDGGDGEQQRQLPGAGGEPFELLAFYAPGPPKAHHHRAGTQQHHQRKANDEQHRKPFQERLGRVDAQRIAPA
jgi:hypothetical protein